MRSYLPAKESLLLAWATNFAAVIAATPANFGLIVGDATAISAAVNDFATKYATANNPATRTQTAIDAKDTAKAAMLVIIRRYGMAIKNSTAVTDANKINCGVGVKDITPTAVPVPGTFPLVSVVAATPGQHEIRFADSATPDSRAKPEGAIGMLLFVFVGTVDPASPEAYKFAGMVTKQPHKLDFSSADAGKKAFYLARWITRTGLEGPNSNPVSFTIAG